jgi:ADP-heptose:LPS heptosyltransferase
METKKIIISRTDSIGDVVLTMPICAWIKKTFPDYQLIFLGKSYTEPVVQCFDCIHEFINWDHIANLSSKAQVSIFEAIQADAIIHVFPNKVIARLAKKAKIKTRIGTSHRSFHWLTCTDKMNFTRKNSSLHESQLNFELLRPFGLPNIPSIETINGLVKAYFSPKELSLSEILKFNQQQPYVILHPKSQGSAVEWPISNYMELAKILVENGKIVCFTGTEKEGLLFRNLMPKDDHIIDLSGKLTLTQLFYLIRHAEALVACSTGPLHISGISGICTIGLFSPRRPIHPGRWQPLGEKVKILVKDPDCLTCKTGKPCYCISTITVDQVEKALLTCV